MLVVITESYDENKWMMGRIGKIIETIQINGLGDSIFSTPKIQIFDQNKKEHIIYGSGCWWVPLPDLPDIPKNCKPGDSIPVYVFNAIYNETNDLKRFLNEIAIRNGHMSAADAMIKFREHHHWKKKIKKARDKFIKKSITKFGDEYLADKKLDQNDTGALNNAISEMETILDNFLAPIEDKLQKIQEKTNPPTEETYTQVVEYLNSIK